jgi:hypothetical protein
MTEKWDLGSLVWALHPRSNTTIIGKVIRLTKARVQIRFFDRTEPTLPHTHIDRPLTSEECAFCDRHVAEITDWNITSATLANMIETVQRAHDEMDIEYDDNNNEMESEHDRVQDYNMDGDLDDNMDLDKEAPPSLPADGPSEPQSPPETSQQTVPDTTERINIARQNSETHNSRDSLRAGGDSGAQTTLPGRPQRSTSRSRPENYVAYHSTGARRCLDMNSTNGTSSNRRHSPSPAPRTDEQPDTTGARSRSTSRGREQSSRSESKRPVHSRSASRGSSAEGGVQTGFAMQQDRDNSFDGTGAQGGRLPLAPGAHVWVKFHKPGTMSHQLPFAATIDRAHDDFDDTNPTFPWVIQWTDSDRLSTVDQSRIVREMTEEEWDYILDRAIKHGDSDITLYDCQTALATMKAHPASTAIPLFAGFTLPPSKRHGAWRTALDFITSTDFTPHLLVTQHIYTQWPLSQRASKSFVEANDVLCDLLEQCVLGSAEHQLMVLVYKCLPMMLLRVSARESRDTQTRRIEQNCTKFINGHIQALFQAALPRRKQTNQVQRQQPPDPAARKRVNVIKAQEFAQKGNLSKCCQRLLADDPTNPSLQAEDTAGKLREKHPPPPRLIQPSPQGSARTTAPA